jgi:hypothetical protein
MLSRFSLTSILWRSATGLLLTLAGCVDPYLPDVPDANANLLVVDGFIKGNGRTRIQLSRTLNIASDTPPPVEKGAKLFIVDDAGTRYALTEIVSGRYQSDSLLLSPARQYQLRITTAAGVAYASDLVPLKLTPAIDNVTFRRDGGQIHLALSTHDPAQQARYYRWGLTETWEFNSAFFSTLEYDPVQKIIVDRLSPIYTCWRTERPSTIRQGSTAQLSQDVLNDFPLATLDAHDERFKIRYSVLVNQYAQTPAEFAYYELLRKNTETVGSVNDPLPTQLTGNVHRVDGAAEPVLGYVGAHTVQQKRIFINYQDLAFPNFWNFNTPKCDSLVEYVPDKRRKLFMPNTNVFNSPTSTPVEYYYEAGALVGYWGSSAECVDCRTRGSITKPSYW